MITIDREEREREREGRETKSAIRLIDWWRLSVLKGMLSTWQISQAARVASRRPFSADEKNFLGRLAPRLLGTFQSSAPDVQVHVTVLQRIGQQPTIAVLPKEYSDEPIKNCPKWNYLYADVQGNVSSISKSGCFIRSISTHRARNGKREREREREREVSTCHTNPAKM